MTEATPRLRDLPDGRKLARTTVHPRGWEPWALSAALASGLRLLLALDPDGYDLLRVDIKTDMGRSRGQRLHICAVWEPVRTAAPSGGQQK